MIFFVLAAIFICTVVSVFAVLRYRKIMREAKNYERGLKMMTLMIHLPPSSEDIDIGGRDARDVTEETISKAQVLYNIIASTATKEGFKSKLYGQRHIGLEIVAKKGAVRFYVAVPVVIGPVIEQAVVGAYPSAQVEEVAEHNLFSPVGKISGTIGGELELKENYAQPIATFQETKRDAMQSLLNAFANLSNEDGAAVQILIRPAQSSWTKSALSVAADKRDKKGGSNDAAKAAGGFAKDLAKALWQPPEPKDKKPEDKPELSSLERANIDAIEDKTRHPGFETLIRVVASSNTAARSQAILNNVVAAFALFDAPGKNGFKFTPARDIENFVTAFIFRFFPQQSRNLILNSVELATIWHLPDRQSTPISSLERQGSKQVDGPNKLSEEGLLLGYNVFRGVKKEIRLSDEDRRRHLYTVGQTGTGKSVLLENMALQDMLDGRGFAFIDPHGDAVERLISLVPKERTEDVIYFSPADMDHPLGLNLFEFQNPEQKDFLIQEAINMLYKLYDPQHTGIIGPRYEHWFRNAALTLMSDPEGSTFIDIPKLFTDNRYAKQKLQHVTDQTVREFWEGEMAKTSDYHKSEILGWFVSKFGAFMSNEMMRNIIGQTKSSMDLRQVMDDGKILFVNLSKGRTGELNSKLLGMIFVMKFQAAAMSRAAIPEEHRRDFSLYVDEFQNFSTDSFATILSEARKYRLNLIVANQFITQLTEEIRDAVFGNVGSIIGLRVGANDADFLTKQFSPIFETEDLVKLPNYNAVVRLMISGVPSQPFTMATVPPLGHPNPQLGQALKRLSAAKYGRPRAAVEKIIFDRLTVKSEPAPPPQNSPFGGFGAAPPPGTAPTGQPASTPSSSGSFLDEWLAKRRQQQAQKLAGTDEPMVLAKSQTEPKPPKAHQKVKPVKQPPTKTDEETGSEFARAKARGEIELDDTNPMAGHARDKDEVTNLAEIVKQQINLQPQPETVSAPKPAPKPDETAAQDQEIVIDAQGRISYKKSNADGGDDAEAGDK